MPKSNIEISWAPIFEWYAIRFTSKNTHQKDKCLKKIGLLDQNKLTILRSIDNTIVG